MGVALGYAVLAIEPLMTGLNKLEISEEALSADLDAAWEVAETDQTVMRRYGVQSAYEEAQGRVTRGKTVTAADLRALVGRWRSRGEDAPGGHDAAMHRPRRRARRVRV